MPPNSFATKSLIFILLVGGRSSHPATSANLSCHSCAAKIAAYPSPQMVHTYKIDGLWAHLWSFRNSRLGVCKHRLKRCIREFEWRSNTRAACLPQFESSLQSGTPQHPYLAADPSLWPIDNVTNLNPPTIQKPGAFWRTSPKGTTPTTTQPCLMALPNASNAYFVEIPGPKTGGVPNASQTIAG